MLAVGESERATKSHDLRRLSLKAAIEFDKLARGQEAERAIIEDLITCLKGPPDGASPGKALFLNSHRTITASNRAWHRASTATVSTVEDLAREILGRLESLAVALESDQRPQDRSDDRVIADQMKRFCLSLHQELLAQYAERRPSKRFRYGSA
jgi:hypothetical protein